MAFDENYARSVNAKSLQDDEQHHATEALFAAAMADKTGNGDGLGSLLSRVKYADGTPSKEFESGTKNLAILLGIWTAAVTRKSQSRGWFKVADKWNPLAVQTMCRRVAHGSLAYWMGGNCETCHGADQLTNRRICPTCKGTRRAEIVAGRFETDKIRELVGELDGLVRAHNDRAKRWMSKK